MKYSELILNYIDLFSNFILYSHASIHDKLTWGIQNSTANKCLQTVHTDLLKEEEFSRNVNLGSFIEHYCAILNNACMTNLIGTSWLRKAQRPCFCTTDCASLNIIIMNKDNRMICYKKSVNSNSICIISIKTCCRFGGS